MKNVLLLMLEFDNWLQARAWSYTGSWAFQDGLEENGHHCTVIPVIADRDPKSNESFLFYAKNLLRNTIFDEAWIWCVHTKLDETTWEWLSTVAKKRIGIVMESLCSEYESTKEFQHFSNRKEEVLSQLSHCTHAIVSDEFDINLIQERLNIPACWNVVMVPERFIRLDNAPDKPKAAFIGNKYGDRRIYLEDQSLAELLYRPHIPERDTNLPEKFDQLHRGLRNTLRNNKLTVETLSTASKEMKLIRELLFELHLDGIRMGFSNVNLPSMLKAYAGRVTESMAAATPAVSWLPQNRPECANLFKNGKEIELFSSPNELLLLLTKQANNYELRNLQTIAARKTLLKMHTSRHRINQYHEWIDKNIAPTFYLP